MVMSIDTLLERMERLDDWQERYRYLIALGKKLPDLAPEQKTEEHRVEGCVSKVWLVLERVDGEAMHFAADSDSAIVKGLITLVLALYSGKTPKEIVATDVDAVFERIGLDRHLSPNRRNGFYSMVLYIKRMAVQQAMASA